MFVAANERLIAEPVDNTLEYYRKPFYIALTVYVLAFVLTYDYYGTAKGFSRPRPVKSQKTGKKRVRRRKKWNKRRSRSPRSRERKG